MKVPASHRGFTLLEVLIALMILAIAITAMLRLTNENLQHVDYLKQKTYAHWVGQNILAQLQAGLIVISPGARSQQGNVNSMANTWAWQVTQAPTTLPGTRLVEIEVRLSSNSTTDQPALATVWGYVDHVAAP